MGLRICQACLRRYKDHRTRCPYCGAQATSQEARRGSPGSGASRGWAPKGLVLVAVLLAVSIWQSMTRVEGPEPAMEALHSEEEAVAHCEVAIDSALAARAPSGAELLAEYLQGGEYRVTGNVEVLDGRIRARRGVVCELQFRAEFGWRVEHIELDTR